MKDSQDPDFGATGQFELTGVYFADKKVDAAFASTLGMDQIKSLVLLGAGPVHVQVLRELARQRRADLDVTLVTPWPYHVPADLLPLCVAGGLTATQCQIDLAPLLQSAGVRWIPAQCDGLDAGTSSVLLNHVGGSTAASSTRPSVLNYHLLGIDTSQADGTASAAGGITGAAAHGLDTTPTERFLAQWPATAERLQALAAQRSGQPLHLVVVGQGTQAFEMACALHQWASAQGLSATVVLATHGAPLLSEQAPGVRRRAQAMLRRLGIAVAPAACERLLPQGLVLQGAETLRSDLTVLALQATTPEWLAHSGLALDGAGRVATSAQLQSVSHRQVLVVGAASDTESASGHRSGVADLGATLALNLRALASEQPLTPRPPPQRSLGFIDCGYGHAIAHWGPWSAEGQWAWRWKHKADLAYLARQRTQSAP